MPSSRPLTSSRRSSWHAEIRRGLAVDRVVVGVERDVGRRELRERLEHLRRAAGRVLVQVEPAARRPSARAGDTCCSRLRTRIDCSCASSAFGARERARWVPGAAGRPSSRAAPRRRARSRRRSARRGTGRRRPSAARDSIRSRSRQPPARSTRRRRWRRRGRLLRPSSSSSTTRCSGAMRLASEMASSRDGA